jgi:hypothetical protein
MQSGSCYFVMPRFIRSRRGLLRKSFEGIAPGDLPSVVLPFSAHMSADVP